MNDIVYRKGSLFDANPSGVLTHACNCKGVWGSGIAAAFHEFFPRSRETYTAMCLKEDMYGKGRVIEDPSGQLIGCLFTSRDYGNLKDRVPSIVEATGLAILDLDKHLDRRVHIHSPKINAGLFGVPWDKTALTITHALRKTTNIESWTVWEF